MAPHPVPVRVAGSRIRESGVPFASRMPGLASGGFLVFQKIACITIFLYSRYIWPDEPVGEERTGCS